MKFLLYITALFVVLVNQSSAFVAPVGNGLTTASTTHLSMGLFDMFSEEKRRERKEREDRLREEQEEAQRQILERRRNPEAMEEYEARVSVRRKLYMAGREDLAEDFKVMNDDEKKSK